MVKKMTRQERQVLEDQKRLEALQRRKIKAFNRLLQDKNIRSIVKEPDGHYCITFKNGAIFRAGGHVVDNSLIYEKGCND